MAEHTRLKCFQCVSVSVFVCVCLRFSYQFLFTHREAFLVQLCQVSGLELCLQLGLCCCYETPAEKQDTFSVNHCQVKKKQLVTPCITEEAHVCLHLSQDDSKVEAELYLCVTVYSPVDLYFSIIFPLWQHQSNTWPVYCSVCIMLYYIPHCNCISILAVAVS